MWRPSVRPNIRDRLSLVPVLHLRSLSPAGSTSAAAPPDALPLPLALGRSIHPLTVAQLQLVTSSHRGNSADDAYGRTEAAEMGGEPL